MWITKRFKGKVVIGSQFGSTENGNILGLWKSSDECGDTCLGGYLRQGVSEEGRKAIRGRAIGSGSSIGSICRSGFEAMSGVKAIDDGGKAGKR